jgi:hypothetical protein
MSGYPTNQELGSSGTDYFRVARDTLEICLPVRL